jgi:hypothetical protein
VRLPSIRARSERSAPSDKAPQAGAQPGLGPEAAAPTGGPLGYFGRLWRADLALAQVFWRDMIVVGTVVNLVAIGLAFLAVAFGASTATGIAIFLAPVPYNILLVAAVWRRAAVESSDQAWGARIGALLWFLLALLL